MTSDSTPSQTGFAAPPALLLVLSRALQALATPLVALLIATAGHLGASAQDAISFCNVLFVGNLCASFVVVTSFGPRTIAREIRALDLRGRLTVTLFAALSALLSGLIFSALATTTVTNTVLLSRLGPVLYAVGSTVLLGQPLRGGEWLGFGLIALGVASTVFTGSGFELTTGDVLILASTVVYAVVQTVSRSLLARTSLAAVVFARNFFSAIIFFAIANHLYGPGHFEDAFYGPLWGIMMVYALVVIVAAQFAYYRALSELTPASVARWTFLTPVLAFGYALVINGERPDLTQVAALALVTAGVLVSNVGRRTTPGTCDNAESSLAAS